MLYNKCFFFIPTYSPSTKVINITVETKYEGEYKKPTIMCNFTKEIQLHSSPVITKCEFHVHVVSGEEGLAIQGELNV